MAEYDLLEEGFPLSGEDIEYLNANFSSWEPVSEGSEYGIIIRDYQLPRSKYAPQQSDLMIIIPADYPVGKIDMFYFFPGIARTDGGTIACLENENHFNRDWQRWSRHYEWDPNSHDVVYHLSWVKDTLENEA